MARILTDILIILATALILTLILARLRFPTLIGLFAAGALIGPSGLALAGDPEQVNVLADAGVIFLLFALGLEFSFRKMMSLGQTLLFAGPIQVVLSGTLVGLIMWSLGVTGRHAIVLGMLAPLSSTAVVLKTLDERSEIASPVGRNALGILIFQDLLVVPIMLLLPALSPHATGSERSLLTLALAALGMVFLVVVGTKWIVPRVLLEAARTRSPDVFLLALVGICFAVAALSASLGLSLALGAFLAGLIVSESPYSHQALGYILPFRNLLVSFFFVSIGMLLDLAFLASHWWEVILGVVGLVTLKTLTGTAGVLAIRYPPRVALATGGALAQVGEFTFVLAAAAAGHGILSPGLQQGLLAVGVLTMAATPAMIWGTSTLSGRLANTKLSRWSLMGLHQQGLADAPATTPSDHLLIIGYGLNGRNLARAAREIGIPYTVVEMNPTTVTQERKTGEPIVYGDATNEAVLKQTGAPRARIAAVLIGDPVATRRIVASLRRLSPSLHILARTRFVSEVQALHRLGANEVVPEEYETSLEIFRRIANLYALPAEQTELLVEAIRADHYRLLTGTTDDSETHPKDPAT